MTTPMTYEGTGVDYSTLDKFKKYAQEEARKTAFNAQRLGAAPLESSWGESVFLQKVRGREFGHVDEGLGTKCLVADAMFGLTGKSYYGHIAQDAVAMIVNDMVTLGILPMSASMHLSVGSADWFQNSDRNKALIEGWRKACDDSGMVWGPGETPVLRDIIYPEACVLSGSAYGASLGKVFDPSNIESRDVIVLLESSGIHANGLTLARDIAAKLPEGYMTFLPDGRTYGETLLDPTVIYVPFIEDCLRQGVDIHYAVNITGHGFRKLMRAPGSFHYIIDTLPTQLPIFNFLQTNGPVDDKEAYGNLNMGAGFAIYLPRKEVDKVGKILSSYDHSNKITGIVGGHIEKSNERRVTINPLGIEFWSNSLDIR
jgi:phosphoribosylformylglycinamidine cyclo-ligase